MGLVLLIFIWFVAPFAEIGIIIGLLVSNDKYKKQIRELEKNGLSRRAFLDTTGNRQGCSGKSVSDVPDGDKAPEMPAMPGNEMAAVLEDSKTTEDMGDCDDVPLTTAPPVIRQPQPAVKPRRQKRDLRANLGTLALILGVIFIVLAGLIFATTTWHILSDITKTFLVLACSAVFFGASFMAGNVFRIRKTGNAFYILGSIFLFLSVLAAAYFRLLGAEFILDRENRWKVLWIGSVLTSGAFWAGLKRFNDRIYTQTCLWGTSLSLFFMAKACSVTWNGFIGIMMVYSSVLIFIRAYREKFMGKEEEKPQLRQLLAEGFRSFALLHFWTFGTVAAFRAVFAIWRMAAEGCTGTRDLFLDRFSLFSFTAAGMVSMVSLTFGLCVLARTGSKKCYEQMRFGAAAGTILYLAGWMSHDFIYQMAVVNGAFFLILAIRHRSHSLSLDICGCAAVLMTLISFYCGTGVRVDGLCFAAAGFAVYYLWFYSGERQWPHLVASIGLLPFPLMAKIRLNLSFDQMAAGAAAVLFLTGILARCCYPVMKQDNKVQGQWRMDWYHMISGCIILWVILYADNRWQFVYLLLAALYFLQYVSVKTLRKPALFLSACCAAAAFWQQPFILWPKVVELELKLLPAVWLMWAAGHIWNETFWISNVQNSGYAICLSLLCVDAVLSGNVVDALLLEGLCLAIFIWAQIKQSIWWIRISAGISLAAALFMTRGFWLSIAWWVYLLAAGIGLLVFAGVMEKKRR